MSEGHERFPLAARNTNSSSFIKACRCEPVRSFWKFTDALHDHRMQASHGIDHPSMVDVAAPGIFLFPRVAAKSWTVGFAALFRIPTLGSLLLGFDDGVALLTQKVGIRNPTTQCRRHSACLRQHDIDCSYVAFEDL